MIDRVLLRRGIERLVAQPSAWPLLALSPLVLVCWTLGSARPPAQFPLDLIPTYVAGKLWLAGQLGAVYHDGPWLPTSGPKPEWFAMAQASRVTLPDTAFAYSPVYLALTLPLVLLLKPVTFYWAFATATSLSALLLGFESARLAGVERPWLCWLIALWVALSFPCAYAAMLGQNVVIAAALALLSFRAFERSLEWRGAVYFVLACACKPWCILLLGALLLAGRWRTALRTGGLYFVTLVVLPVIVFPSALVEGYARVFEALPKVSVLAFNNVSLRALIHRILLDDWTPRAWDWAKHGMVTGRELTLELFVVVSVLGSYALLVHRRRPSFRALYTEAMALVLLTLGVCWSHYLVFALPLVVRALFARELSLGFRGVAGLLSLWLWQMMSAAAPIPAVMRPPELWALIYSAPLLLSALLAMALAAAVSPGMRAAPGTARAS